MLYSIFLIFIVICYSSLSHVLGLGKKKIRAALEEAVGAKLFLALLHHLTFIPIIKYIALSILNKTNFNVMEILIWTIITLVLYHVNVPKSHFLVDWGPVDWGIS